MRSGHSRYLWAAGQRERPDEAAFWPGKFARWRTVRRRRDAYQPEKHATQSWLAGYRFFRSDHPSMRGVMEFQW